MSFKFGNPGCCCGGSTHVICGGHTVPSTLHLTTPCGSPVTLSYDSTSMVWTGCGAINYPETVTYPMPGYTGYGTYCGGPFTAAASNAIYTFDCSGSLRVKVVMCSWYEPSLPYTSKLCIATHNCIPLTTAETTAIYLPGCFANVQYEQTLIYASYSAYGIPTYGPFYETVSVFLEYFADNNGTSSQTCVFTITE